MPSIFAFGVGDLLDPLFAFLKCILSWLLGALEWLLVTVGNLLIEAVAGALALMFSLLPTVDLGSVGLPSSVVDAFKFVDYLFPLSLGMALVGVIITIELVRWVFSLVRSRLGFGQ